MILPYLPTTRGIIIGFLSLFHPTNMPREPLRIQPFFNVLLYHVLFSDQSVDIHPPRIIEYKLYHPI